jgi:hypothetical protein
MAIPLIPFVAGAVIGGLVAHFSKDEKLRKGIKQAAGDVSDKVRDTAGTVSHRVSEGFRGLRQKASKEKVVRKKVAVKTPTKKQSTKKAVTKKVSRKKPASKTSPEAQSNAESDASGGMTKSD